MKPSPSPSPGPTPISLTLQLLIVDSRDATRVIEVGKDEEVGTQPESVAALPGRLHALCQAVERDAQRALSQFLAELTAPTPLPPTPVSEPAAPLATSAPGIEVLPEVPAAPTPVPDEYLAPVNLPLLDDALILLPPAGEGPSVVP